MFKSTLKIRGFSSWLNTEAASFLTWNQCHSHEVRAESGEGKMIWSNLQARVGHDWCSHIWGTDFRWKCWSRWNDFELYLGFPLLTFFSSPLFFPCWSWKLVRLSYSLSSQKVRTGRASRIHQYHCLNLKDEVIEWDWEGGTPNIRYLELRPIVSSLILIFWYLKILSHVFVKMPSSWSSMFENCSTDQGDWWQVHLLAQPTVYFNSWCPFGLNAQWTFIDGIFLFSLERMEFLLMQAHICPACHLLPDKIDHSPGRNNLDHSGADV